MDVIDVPLGSVLGDRLGRVFEGVHRDAGVTLRMGQGVAAVEERDGSVLVRTQDGEALEGDAAVVGVGIIPRTELAEEAGLDVENGIVVDASLRASADGVVAAGDVANHDHPLFGRLRIEHFDNALKQGAHAGRVLLGAMDPFDDPHWFWSDQYDHNLQMIGINGPNDDLVVRGSLEERSFTAFFLREGTLRAALALDRGGDVRRAGALVKARARPDPEALADPDVDLRTL
jgi:3-phenylpropionate/trans-cinnamate dioxygenase ferredoxin reductase subunit